MMATTKHLKGERNQTSHLQVITSNNYCTLTVCTRSVERSDRNDLICSLSTSEGCSCGTVLESLYPWPNSGLDYIIGTFTPSADEERIGKQLRHRHSLDCTLRLLHSHR